MQNTITNKAVIITGGCQGLGLVIAEVFLKNGANVIIAARNQEKINSAVLKLTPLCKKNKIIGKKMDITNSLQCQQLITDCLTEFKRIDVLINNAGIHGAKGAFDEVDWALWESAIDTNLKGTALICKATLPTMKKQCAGKIIVISGGGATHPQPFMSAYAASKAALVRFSECLAMELKPFHIDVNAIAPGALNTALLDDILNAGPTVVGEKRYQQALAQQKNGGDDPNRAANLCLLLSSDESNGITGKLISAIWDPWEKFPTQRDELNNSDHYTLRRIVPTDQTEKEKS